MVGGTTAVRTMVGVAVASAGLLLLGALWVSRPDATPADEPGDMVRVGVVQGQSVPGYLSSAEDELAALTNPSAPAGGDLWALVSLDRYVPPGALPALLAGAASAQVLTRVPIPGAKTQTVRMAAYHLPTDVLAGMVDAALQRDQEQAEYRQLSRQLDAGQDRARNAYETAARTAAAEATAYRSGCACVFAAVIRAAPVVLQQVADRPGVRSVDPAPEVGRLDRAEFRPPLPEQDGTVPAEPTGSPQAVPNDSSGIASQTSTPILSSLGPPVRSDSPGDAGLLLHPSVPAPSSTDPGPAPPDPSER
jgi:hypothetical protein